MQPSRTLPLPSIGNATTASALRKLSPSQSIRLREDSSACDSAPQSFSPINLAVIPVSDSKSSTIPRNIPKLKKSGDDEMMTDGGSLRRTSGAGNVLAASSGGEYALKQCDSPKATLKRSSVNLAQSGVAMDDVSGVQHPVARKQSGQMPKMSGTSPHGSTGNLKRSAGSGELLKQMSTPTERSRQNSFQTDAIPSTKLSGSTEMSGLRRSCASRNMVGERSDSIFVGDQQDNQAMPKVQNQNSNEDDGSLKRISVGGYGLGNTLRLDSDSRSFQAQQTTSVDPQPFMSPPITKIRQFGHIHVESKPLSDQSLHLSGNPKVRQSGQASTAGEINANPESKNGASSDPSLKRAKSPKNVTNSSSEFYSKGNQQNGKSTSSKENSGQHYTWDFGEANDSAKPKSNTIGRFKQSSVKRHSRSTTPIHSDQSIAADVLGTGTKINACSFSPTTTLILDNSDCEYKPKSNTMPRPPSASRSNSSPRRRSASRNASQLLPTSPPTKFEGEECFLQGFPADDDPFYEPALLVKRKQVEDTISKRMLGQDTDNMTLFKMHSTIAPFFNRKQLIRHRWLYAIFCVLKLLRSSLVVAVEGGPVFQSRQSKSETIFCSKIRALLREPRSSNIVSAIQKLLFLRSTFLFQFSTDQQIQLCRDLKFAVYPKGYRITTEGQKRRSVYFILSGECAVSSIQKIIHNTLSTGDTFGNASKGRWTASVMCKEPTELLVISRETYSDIMTLGNDEHIVAHMNLLSQIPHFSDHVSPPTLLKPFAAVSQLFTFQPQEPILHEGVENFSVFWIISGSCRAVKLVPFLKQLVGTNTDSKRKKYELGEYDPGVTPMKNGEKVVMQLITICELGTGDHFPEMIGWAETNSKKENGLSNQSLSRSGLLEKLSDTSPSRPDARAYTSIIANTKVEILGMTRLDYVRLATTEMILESAAEAGKLHVPLDMLQKSVLNI